MKVLGVCFLFAIMSTLFSFETSASTCSEIKGKIVIVRDSLMGILKDKSKRTPEQKKLVASSSNEVSTLIEQLPHGDASKADYETMKSTWNDFKRVREEQVVPMIEQGKDAEAEKLATGEQKERLMKVMSLCDKIK